ncbi:MAG: hypothetical protein IKZ33_05300 [Lentisphaeria bacterium]|nr:hypothetical protein [Lentisphaeria bacterium]
MNLLQNGMKWLNQQRENYLSEEISYFRKCCRETLQIPATRGGTLFRSEDDYGVVIRVRSADFIVSADALGYAPERGDKIVCAGREYEVLAPNKEPVWRWCGSDRTMIRIHTKETGVVND